MFNLFKKKSEADINSNDNNENLNSQEDAENKKSNSSSMLIPTGNSSSDIIRITTEIEKIKANLEAFAEVRKSFTERFSRISEQIGELRSMILERDKSIQEIELKAIKAADLVESVQPEKMMTDVQKAEAKIEALKANLEGNEAIMGRVMDELKEAKRKIEFFRGIEEIVKLSEETKKELIEIKKIESKISINTDKVETIYAEMRTKFQDVDEVTSQLQELKVGQEQGVKDIGFLKDKVGNLAEKAELEKLVNKVQRYIDALKDLEKKSSMTKDIEKLKVLLEGLK